MVERGRTSGKSIINTMGAYRRTLNYRAFSFLVAVPLLAFHSLACSLPPATFPLPWRVEAHSCAMKRARETDVENTASEDDESHRRKQQCLSTTAGDASPVSPSRPIVSFRVRQSQCINEPRIYSILMDDCFATGFAGEISRIQDGD